MLQWPARISHVSVHRRHQLEQQPSTVSNPPSHGGIANYCSAARFLDCYAGRKRTPSRFWGHPKTYTRIFLTLNISAAASLTASDPSLYSALSALSRAPGLMCRARCRRVRLRSRPRSTGFRRRLRSATRSPSQRRSTRPPSSRSVRPRSRFIPRARSSSRAATSSAR